ncbi:MAG TPA: hypothetical protein VMR52_09335 [Dehalococcoidia bacterium]|nr:hypothetical protein [Dehalococcoidia bacterium]
MTDPTLKLVVAWSERRNLCTLVREILATAEPEADLLPLGDDVTVMYTALSTGEVRDHLRDVLQSGDHVIVTEFEVWSSYGADVDSRWLLARGH